MTTPDYRLTQLDVLEAEAIHVIREVAAEFDKPVLLFLRWQGFDHEMTMRPKSAHSPNRVRSSRPDAGDDLVSPPDRPAR